MRENSGVSTCAEKEIRDKLKLAITIYLNKRDGVRQEIYQNRKNADANMEKLLFQREIDPRTHGCSR